MPLTKVTNTMLDDLSDGTWSVTNLAATGTVTLTSATVNMTGATVSNLGSVTTADINGGTIDNVTGSFSGNVMGTFAGTGFTAGASTLYKTSVVRHGDLIKTTMFIDLTDLNSGGAAGDIIGLDATSDPCHIGRITAANNGTIYFGRITCIELPAGGDTDVDIYAADESTGVEDGAISGLTETQITNGGTHVAGDTDLFVAMPGADQYLYLVGQDGNDATYTAGQFLIELFGYA